MLCGDGGSPTFLCPGSGVGKAKTYEELFPQSELSIYSPINNQAFNPDRVVSSVILPDNRSYDFRYNVYRELQRIVLPTGGALEYEFDAAPSNPNLTVSAHGIHGAGSGGLRAMIYRRVNKRKVLPDGATVEGTREFAVQHLTGDPGTCGLTSSCTVVTTTDREGDGGTILAKGKRYFHSVPHAATNTESWGYAEWRDGREFKSEAMNPSDQVLSRTENLWEQRAPVPWWTAGADFEPGNDTRLAQTDTTQFNSTGSSGKLSRQAFGYDSSNRYNNRTDVDEYDFGAASASPTAPGALVRKTHTVYEGSAGFVSGLMNDPINATLLMDIYLPSLTSQVWICPGASACAQETDADSKSRVTYDGGTLTARTGIIGHETDPFSSDPFPTWVEKLPADFPVGSGKRGNPTTNEFWQDLPTPTWLSTNQVYDVAGNLVSATDARNFTTTLGYDDNYSDSVNRNTFAFATAATNAVGHSTAMVYDYNLGRPTRFTDPNGTHTDFSYTGALDRLGLVIEDPGDFDSGRTQFTYVDTPNASTVKTSVLRRPGVTTPLNVASEVLLDGLGRPVENRQYETASTYNVSCTEYDGLGRANFVSNPSLTGCSTLGDTTVYDALGRALTVTHADGSVMATAYGESSATVTDETGVKRQSISDALGRLTEVYEAVGSAQPIWTTYAYDLLDNLTDVCQNRSGAVCGQTRTLLYDSLGQLASATNPEQTAPIQYFYDPNGNLSQRTDANGTATTYVYDEINRLEETHYSLGAGVAATPSVYRCYDGNDYSDSPAGCSTNPGVAPAIGRLSAVGTVGLSKTGYTYDDRGRITVSVR